MDGPGFHVDVDVLEVAAADIAQSVADQRAAPLADVDLAAGAYGHAGLHRSIQDFCERWNAGLDLLLEDAKTVSDVLARASRAYREADTGAAGRLSADPAERVVDD